MIANGPSTTTGPTNARPSSPHINNDKTRTPRHVPISETNHRKTTAPRILLFAAWGLPQQGDGDRS